jgi:hypothetical protein
MYRSVQAVARLDAEVTNSGPLSERRCCGAPRSLTSRESTSITRPDRIRPSTSIAKPSLVPRSVQHVRRCSPVTVPTQSRHKG